MSAMRTWWQHWIGDYLPARARAATVVLMIPLFTLILWPGARFRGAGGTVLFFLLWTVMIGIRGFYWWTLRYAPARRVKRELAEREQQLSRSSPA